jgi:outer membrane receptor for ferrienterochelin and colicins
MTTRRIVLLLILSFHVFSLNAQRIAVKSTSGEIIPGAWIELSVAGAAEKRIQITDANGIASFSIVNKQQVLLVKMTGFNAFKDTLHSGCSSFNAALQPGTDSLGTVTITAQWSATTTGEAVQQVRVIDRKEIDARGAQTLRDVLSNELNMRPAEDAVLGSSTSLMGLSGENVKILIDGIPVIGRLNGNVDLSQLNLQNIDRIEIVEGPLSVSYGTNALAGAINLITKKQQTANIAAETELFYQSSGQFNSNLRLSGRCKRSILAVSGSRNFFDGWSSWQQPFYVDWVPVADTTRTDQWKPREQHMLNGYSCTYFSRSSLSFNADVFSEKMISRGAPRNPYGETAFDDQFTTSRNSFTAGYRWQPRPHFILTTTAAVSAFERVKNTWLRDLTTLSNTLASGNGLQDTSAFSLQLLRSVAVFHKDSSHFRFESGIDINRETALGKRIEGNNAEIIDAAAFGAGEYRTEKLVLRAGVRAAWNSVFSAPVIPSLQLKYNAGKKIIIRASWGQGFRAPSLKELYFYFVDVNHNIQGNTLLKAETANSFMLNMQHKITRKKLTINSSLQLFANDIRNLITLAQITSTEFSYINVGRYKTTGITGNVQVNFGNWNFSAGASETGRFNQLYTEDNTLPEYVWSTELRSNIVYTAEKPAIQFSVWWKYNGSLPGYALNNNGTAILTQVDAWNMLDAQFTKGFFSNQLRFSAGIKNLTNVRSVNTAAASGTAHSSGTSQPVATGRQYFFRLQWQFQYSVK